MNRIIEFVPLNGERLYDSARRVIRFAYSPPNRLLPLARIITFPSTAPAYYSLYVCIYLGRRDGVDIVKNCPYDNLVTFRGCQTAHVSVKMCLLCRHQVSKVYVNISILV